MMQQRGCATAPCANRDAARPYWMTQRGLRPLKATDHSTIRLWWYARQRPTISLLYHTNIKNTHSVLQDRVPNTLRTFMVALVKGAWGGRSPTSKVQKVLPLPCLLLCSGAVFRRAWNRALEKKKFHFVKTFGPESPVKPSFQEI